MVFSFLLSVKSEIISCVTESSSPDTKYVMRAYVHSVTARHPLIRYSVGWKAKFLYVPLSYMPSALYDHLMARLSSKLVPACLKQ